MQKGDFVEIEYVGKVKESGEIFDLTDEKMAKDSGIYNPSATYGPITIVVGANHVLAGLDKWLEKADIGKEIHIVLAPEEAFGVRSAELIKLIPLSEFRKQNVAPQIGQFITFHNGVKGRILSIAGGRVKIDFNHPLASKTLEYKLKINRRVDTKDEQVKALLTYYLGSKVKATPALEGKNLKVELPSSAKLPAEIKQKLAEEITKHVTDLEKVEFVESFAKAQNN